MAGHTPWRNIRRKKRDERAGWTAHIVCDGDPAEADTAFDDLLFDFVDALLDCGGAVSGSLEHHSYGATFSVYTDSPSVPEVVELALLIFHEAAAKSGLPAWPVVRCEIMTFAEHDVDLER